jgi:Carboxypeptidase regulatory-like domain
MSDHCVPGLRFKSSRRVVLALLLAFAAVQSVAGQTTTTFGAIEGTVTDETGGALPGVTLTLTSPALQLSEVSGISDGQGRYRFGDLRVGVYRVVAELPGFQSVIRENVELSVGFVARIDITLKVGSVAETVTVSGASPVVDVTTTRGGQTINTLVASRYIPLVGHESDVVRLTPGLSGGIGARSGNPTQVGLQGNMSLSAYGQAGVTAMVEDFEMHSNNQPPNLTDTEQMDVKTYGTTADVQFPGAAINYVFSSGGNTLHSSGGVYVMGNAVQSSNIDDPLRGQGFNSGENLQNYYDTHVNIGGPIKQDKWWFFLSGRKRKNERTIGGFAANPGPDGKYLTGDEPPAYPYGRQDGSIFKSSFQASRNYQIIGFWWRDFTKDNGTCTTGFFGGASCRTIPFEHSAIYYLYDHVWFFQVRGTPRNNFTFDVKGGRTSYHTKYDIQPGSATWLPGSPLISTLPSSYDRNTTLYTGSPIATGVQTTAQRFGTTYYHQLTGNLTYIPQGIFGGDHQFRAGFRTILSTAGGAVPNHPAGNYILVFDTVGGVPHQPVEMTTFSFPLNALNRLNLDGIYATDQWRLRRRLTLNLGLRFDYEHSFIPEQVQEASMFAQARTYAPVDVGKWRLWSPRAAAAWDVTGDAKTVAKATYGKYNSQLPYYTTNFADMYNSAVATTTAYRWHDLNGDNNYQPGEVNLSTAAGAPDFISITGAANTQPLDDGAFKVPSTHEFTASIEREMIPNMSGRFLYVFKQFVHQYDTINVARPYSAYNIPLSRRDPGPDGTVGTADDGGMVTIYDYDPAYRGAAFTLNARLNRPDNQADVAQTIEGSVQKRLSNRWSLGSSFGATKQHRWIQGVIENPNQNDFPLDETWNYQFRLNGSYTFPYEILFGGTLTTMSGIKGQRTYVFRAADPLGGAPLRQLSTVTVRLEPWGSQRGPTQNYMDLRLGKSFAAGRRGRIEVSLDAINALNTNVAQAMSFVSGPTFGQITQIPAPRIVRFGAQYSF